MKKHLVHMAYTLLAGILLAAPIYADTLTPNIGMTQPTLNSAGWGTKLNNNFGIIDSSEACHSCNNVMTGTNTYTLPMTLTSTGTLLLGNNNQVMLYSSGTVLIMDGGTSGFHGTPLASNPQIAAFGYGALSAVTVAFDESAFGSSALASDTGGDDNAAFGIDDLLNLTTGFYNTAIGSSVLGQITTGYYNTCVGVGCMNAGSGGPFQNEGMGINTLQVLGNGGHANTAIGSASYASITTGYQNVGLGSYSGDSFGLSGAGGTGSFDNTCIGYQACFGTLVGTGTVMVGAQDVAIPTTTLTNAIGLGWDAFPTASNTAQVGGTLGSGKEINMFVASMTVTAGLTGTTAANNAPAGDVGESTFTHVQAVNAAATTQFKTITSITLTAGDWDVSGALEGTLNGSTPSGVFGICISSFTNNTNTDCFEGDNELFFLPPTSTNVVAAISVPMWRVNVASPTAIYLKGYATYSAGTPQFNGRISARRMR